VFAGSSWIDFQFGSLDDELECYANLMQILPRVDFLKAAEGIDSASVPKRECETDIRSVSSFGYSRIV
jgi:hypothetical protein